MYRQLICETRGGGAIIGLTEHNMVDHWSLEALSPERYDKVRNHKKTKINLHNQLMLWMG